MNRFILPSGMMTLAAAGLLTVYHQHQGLESLRSIQQKLILRASTAGAPLDHDTPAAPSATSPAPPSSEVMKARNEVNQLARRKKDLAAVQAENERLRSQLAVRATNSSAGLSGRFLRRSEARMMGYASPEHTLETFLWAVQNQNTQALFEVFTPEMARQIKEHSNSGNPASFFKETEGLIGRSVVGQKQLPDGSVEMSVALPLEETPQPFRFHQFGNQWKMDLP